MNELQFLLPRPPTDAQPGVPVVEIPRTKRPRAKRSCDLCRKKKTRCNSDEMQPCSVCRAAGTTCEFQIDQKKRGPVASSYVQELEERVQHLEGLLHKMASGDRVHFETMCAEDRVLDTSDAMATMTGNNAGALEDQMSNLSLTDYERTTYIGNSAGFHMFGQQLLSTNVRYRIREDTPWVLQKVNEEKEEHVIIRAEEYTGNSRAQVRDRGMYFEDMPEMSEPLADLMIEAYFVNIHPYYPVVNKLSFLEQYYYQHPQPTDIYLLKAICFAGAQCFVNQNKGNKEVFKLYQSLASQNDKFLEVVHKYPKVSTVQALLLLSMFAPMNDEIDGSLRQWFTAGLAIRVAQGLGLHRVSTRWKIPDHEIELRRRVWYVAYILDREIAALMGRPIAILDDDFDVEIPSPYELPSTFQTQISESERPALIMDAERAIRDKTPVYDTFVHHIGISRILGQILLSLYAPKVVSSVRTNLYLIEAFNKRLSAWKADLPSNLLYDPNETGQTLMNAGLLHIAYNCLLLLLHRPFIGDEDAVFDIPRALKALSDCSAAASQIADTVTNLEDKGFTCLPRSFVSYAMFQAAIIFMHNAKSENPHTARQGIINLKRCAETFNREESLRDDSPARILTALASKLQLTLVECRGQKPHHDPAIQPSAFCPKRQLANLNPLRGLANLFTAGAAKSQACSEVPSFNTSDASNPSSSDASPTPMFDDQQQHQGVSPDALLNSSFEFDLSSLVSEMPLWNAPSGTTWSEWGPYLQL